MYFNHFGLHSDPFRLDPSLKYVFVSQGHQEVMAHLVYGLEQGESFVLISGDVGTGKTLALQFLVSEMAGDFQPVFINVTSVDFLELMKMILDGAGLEYDRRGDRADLLRILKGHLIGLRDRKQRLVLVVDEAHNLALDTMEGLRMLANLTQPGEPALQIVLAGQPALDVLLRDPRLEQLDQRIRVRYRLPHLAAAEVGPYIATRLQVGGLALSPFSKGAVERIFELSGGIPRLVNQFAGQAMLAAFVAGSREVKAEHLQRSMEGAKSGKAGSAPDGHRAGANAPVMAVRAEPGGEMHGAASRPRPAGRARWALLAVVVAIAVVAVLAWTRGAIPARRVSLSGPGAVADSLQVAEPAVAVAPLVEAIAEEDPMPAGGAIAAPGDTLPAPSPAAATAVAVPPAPRPGDGPGFVIHVASFRTPDHAESFRRVEVDSGYPAFVRMFDGAGGTWHRVYFGPFADRGAARDLAEGLVASGEISYYKIIDLAGADE